MIDLEKMAKEHEKLFPNATLESQVAKLEEEVEEFYDQIGKEEMWKELADIWIVCAGLYRFSPILATSVFGYFSHYVITGYCSSLMDGIQIYGKVDQEVNRKWQINLKRKWEWNGKTYHHIKTGDDE